MSETPSFRKTALKSTIAAAHWFTEAAKADGVRLQPRKLQHLLYMAQGLYAAANDGRPLAPSRFIAGSLGPADPNLYPVLEHAGDLIGQKEIDSRAEACMKLIMTKFGALPIEQLESFIETDGIFATVREAAPDAEIPLEMMADAYRKLFLGGGTSKKAPKRTAAPQKPAPQPDMDRELPEGVPRVITGGKPVQRWMPKKRIY
ncbi:MAG: Panacea domain-containing protein [Minwuia sp.]|uniref:Panacea domain-containing protein n=1 Tax=Minwuia sp. TaxID=2493630 RepID=UPI003A86B44D